MRTCYRTTTLQCMLKHAYAPSLVQRVLDLHEQQMSPSEIARRLGDISGPTARNVLIQSGVEPINGRNARVHRPVVPMSKKHIDAIVSGYAAGKTGTALATELGLGVTSVYRVLTANGVQIRNSRRTLSEAQERNIADRYTSGERALDLAREYGVDIATIRNTLRRLEVPSLRPVSPNRRPFVDQVDGPVVVAKRLDGWTQMKIANELQVSLAAVRRHLARNGMGGLRFDGRYSGDGKARHLNDGYVWVIPRSDDVIGNSMRRRGGYVLEHRLAMAHKLGRPLVANENVHHINGIRDDNAIENLELWFRSQPAGIRASDHHCPGCTCQRSAD